MKSIMLLLLTFVSISAYCSGGSGFGGDAGGGEEEIVVKPSKFREEADEVQLGKSCLVSMGITVDTKITNSKMISDEIKKTFKKKVGRSIASVEKTNMNFDCHLFAKLTKDKELINLIAPIEIVPNSTHELPANTISK